MQDKKNKKTATGKRSKPRQQSGMDKKSVRRVTDKKSTQTQATHHTNPSGNNARRENVPIQLSNQRRIKKHSKAYVYIVAIVLIILGAILFLVLFTFTGADLASDAQDIQNLFGWIGAHLADITLNLFGLASFIFSAVCLLLGVRTLCGRHFNVNQWTFVGLAMLLAGTSPILHIAFGDKQILEHSAGGAIGKWLTGLAQPHLTSGWIITIALTMCLFGILFVTDTSIKAFFLGLWKYLLKGLKAGGRKLKDSLKRSPKPEIAEESNQSQDDSSEQEQSEEQPVASSDSLYQEDSPSQLLNSDSQLSAQNQESLQDSTPDPESYEKIPNQAENELKSDDLAAVTGETPDNNDEDPDNLLEDDLVDISDQELNDVAEVLREEIKSQSDNEGQTSEKDEKAERPEGLNDLMARILKNSHKVPKSRPVRRNHSVPAIEPQYEFDSIMSPEQIANKSVANTNNPNHEKLTAGVLGDWKPRSIGRKSSASTDAPNAQNPTIALTAAAESDYQQLSKSEKPANITEDVIAKLSSGEMDDISDPALAETQQLPQKKLLQNIHDAATRVGDKNDADDADLLNQIAGIMHSGNTSKNKEKSESAQTIIPVSSELRSLMAEASPDYKPRFDFDHVSDERPNKPAPQAPSNPESINPPTPHQSFVVAEEKKRASEDELNEADRVRQKNLNTSIQYQRPPLSLLHYDPSSQKGFDHEAMKSYANKIEEKLLEYHIEGQVIQICPGPIITRFEFQPAPGTKVSKISSLSDDLMMALEITSIRILAPIPGKNVVGIEIPNEKRDTIYLKEVLGSKEFCESKSMLTIALGKDSEGTPVVSDLAKMPHLLVAGSTGSGKSVAINTMICSLLYNATPDEVKLILVDPKCLELSIYEGIPHLLVPPITTPQETAAALDWACEEMDERYRLLSSFGVRNIAGYNEQIKNPTLPRAIERMAEKDEDGNAKYKSMPYIVIIVDEFADLMMTSGKEIETSIARLAQKARAAGIHIILATQRPSTNVITGVIKANFPTRLAFRVFSYVDSRTILDTKGAESLLGMGDSLFLPPNSAILQRVHGAFVSDDEVQSIVDFLASQRKPEYNLDITAPKNEENADNSENVSSTGEDGYDSRYDEAVRIVAEAGQASASFLQRRMGIGFQRASRIIDQMERDGVVGPQKGQKPREVLVKPM